MRGWRDAPSLPFLFPSLYFPDLFTPFGFWNNVLEAFQIKAQNPPIHNPYLYSQKDVANR